MRYIAGVGGDGFKIYDRIIKEKFSGGCLKNIYSGVTASEGLWSVPGGIDTEDSVMAPCSAFFEFLPVECGDDLSRCVTMDKVEVGKIYEIIVTNLSGFYRYRTSDAVMVTGFRGQTPMIRFMYRVNRTINMAAEKTTEKALQAAVEGAMDGKANGEFAGYVDTGRLKEPVAHWLQPQTAMLYRDMMVFKGASANQLKPVRVIMNEKQRQFFFVLLMK